MQKSQAYFKMPLVETKEGAARYLEHEMKLSPMTVNQSRVAFCESQWKRFFNLILKNDWSIIFEIKKVSYAQEPMRKRVRSSSCNEYVMGCEWVSERVGVREWVSKCASKWVCEWVGVREWVNECERVSEWVNARVSKWVREWVNECERVSEQVGLLTGEKWCASRPIILSIGSRLSPK